MPSGYHQSVLVERELALGDNRPMTAETYPLRVLPLTLAGRINVQQRQVIEYLVEENRVLKEQLGGKRVPLNDDQRRRLAAKAWGTETRPNRN